MAHDAAGERDERIGNRETENFYFAAVLGETGDKSRVIAGCTKQKPGTGGEIRVHEQLDDKRDERHQDNRGIGLYACWQTGNKIVFKQCIEGEQLHVRAAGDMQVD